MKAELWNTQTLFHHHYWVIRIMCSTASYTGEAHSFHFFSGCSKDWSTYGLGNLLESLGIMISYWDASILLSFLVWGYCSPVWSSAADSHLKLLDKNLRACKFLIPNLTVSLQHHRFMSSLCMLYKIFHNPSHPLHSELSNLFCPRRVTRGSLNISSLSFSLMRFHTSQYSRCFIPSTTKLWNKLPSMILEATELQKLKIGTNAFFIGCGWTVVCFMSLSFLNIFFVDF